MNDRIAPTVGVPHVRFVGSVNAAVSCAAESVMFAAWHIAYGENRTPFDGCARAPSAGPSRFLKAASVARTDAPTAASASAALSCLGPPGTGRQQRDFARA